MARTTHNGNGDDRQDLRHVTETPDVSHIKNLDVTHEASDISVSGVLKFVVGLTVLTVVVFMLMWGMFRFLSAQETEREPPAGPMAMTEQERLPPEPRLQAAKGFGVKLQNGEWVTLENKEPEAEYHVLREQWDRRLNCSGEAGSPEESTDCIPINVAIDKLLEGGSLRVRESVNNSQKPADVALPTAASSGRMTEKGKQ
jgi:hypothetical protein